MFVWVAVWSLGMHGRFGRESGGDSSFGQERSKGQLFLGLGIRVFHYLLEFSGRECFGQRSDGQVRRSVHLDGADGGLSGR